MTCFLGLQWAVNRTNDMTRQLWLSESAKEVHLICNICIYTPRWWFQTFLMFTPIWGRFPFWLIFFRWVETTNQNSCIYKCTHTHTLCTFLCLCITENWVYLIRFLKSLSQSKDWLNPCLENFWDGLFMMSREVCWSFTQHVGRSKYLHVNLCG